MREIPFIKYTPGGNPTILIPNVAFDQDKRAKVALELMDVLHLHAEQVGYAYTDTQPELIMMGGEFCINATRSMAVFMASLNLLQTDSATGWQSGQVKVSGALLPLNVRVKGDKGSYTAAVCLDAQPKVQELDNSTWIVSMPGITHLVVAAEPDCMGAPRRTHTADALLAQYQLKDLDAAGVIWMTDTAIDPVVWVRHTASLCEESACGSGTLAAACVRALCKPMSLSHTFVQPSKDSLTVDFTKDSALPWQAWVSGPVRVVAEGIASVYCLQDEA